MRMRRLARCSARPLASRENRSSSFRAAPAVSSIPVDRSPELDIQVDDVEGVFFYEFAALFDVFAHEGGENCFGGDGIFQAHFEQGAHFRVHGGVPQLLWIHFAEALEARDGETLAGVFQDVIEQAERTFLHDFLAIVGDGEGAAIEFGDGRGESAPTLIIRHGREGPIDAAFATVFQDQLVQAVLFVEDEFRFEVELGFFDGLHQLLQFLFVGEIGFLVEVAFGQQINKFRFAQAAAQFRGDLVVFLNIQEKSGEVGAFERFAVLALYGVLFGGALHQLAGEFALVADVAVHLAALHAIERRLRDINISFFDQLAHVAEEKSEQQRANVAAVHVRVGHENNFVIAQLAGVEIILADPGAERGDDAANFLVAEHLVVAGFFDVEDLAIEGQDGLVAAIAAAFGGAAGGFTLDEEDFAARGIAFLAIGELSGQAAGIESGFAASELAGLAGGFARASCVNTLADNFSRDGGMLVEIFAKALVDHLLDYAFDVAIELALSLAFELGLRKFHGDDGDEAFADVVTIDGDFVLLLLEHAERIGVVVDGARERGAEAGKVRAAVHGVDGVGEGEHIFGVTVVVLQRDFHFHLVALAFDVDGRIVQDAFAFVEVLDEFGDAAGEAELRFFAAALVIERDFQAFVEEGEFAEALRERVVAIDGIAENFGIGVKSDLGAGLARLAGSFELRGGDAFFVGLFPDFAFAPDFQIEPVGKRVDGRDADAVQATGNFVGVAIEFSAGVQDGHDDFGGGLFFGGMHVHGNAAAVVNYGDAVVFVHGDVDLVAESGHGFVHGIVGDFPDQVMQSHFTGGTDVHRGAFADGFDAAENFDGSRVVLVAASFSGCSIFFSHGSCFSSDCVRMQFANYALRLREGGRADVPDTCSPGCGELPCPLVSLTRSWVRIHSRARCCAGETRRVAAPSRPVPKNSGRRGGAFLIFPCGKGNMRREIGFSCPGAGKKNRGKFGPNIVPFRRNSERDYCNEIERNSQGETVVLD